MFQVSDVILHQKLERHRIAIAHPASVLQGVRRGIAN